MISKLLARNKTNLLYGACLGALVFLLNWLELRFVIFEHSFEIYAGAIAIIFTSLGIWLAIKLTKPKVETVVVEKYLYTDPAIPFVLNEKALEDLGMSKRELEVLQLMAEGLSNQEIARQLFVSLNTIKTHSSKIFEKMDVQRRTQAVEKAKRIGLIP
ncbi:MAG: DNA-binding response regulator [Sediminibacterium sp.]|nr:DNA-binding response regulator [Sediminibacterium sp.]